MSEGWREGWSECVGLTDGVLSLRFCWIDVFFLLGDDAQ